MKKKLTAMVVAAACALTCAFALVGCGGGDNDPYYNKTYTLSGTCKIDWEGKDYIYTSPAGVEDRDVSQRQILEKIWDEIDWDITFIVNGINDPSAFPHSNVDEFIGKFADFEQNYFKDAAGLKFSFSGKDERKLTLTLPEDWDSSVGREITMPFAETPEQFAEIKPHAEYVEGFFSNGNSEPGYYALGVYKIDDDHFITVEFQVEKYVENIIVSIGQYTVETQSGSTWLDQEPILYANSLGFSLCNAEHSTLWDVRYRLDFEVT